METPQTNNFSRKCRDKVNTHFARLRKIMSPYFPDSSDWNRFRIIERALVLLGARKSDDFETEITSGQKSNKEACAIYRSKLNRSFDELKVTLQARNLVNLREYRLFTRAGILACAISSLQVILEKPVFQPIGISTMPVIRSQPILNSCAALTKKRSSDELFLPQTKFSRTPDSTGSISPRSDESATSPVNFSEMNFDQSALARVRALAFLQMISLNTIEVSDKKAKSKDNVIWRPW